MHDPPYYRTTATAAARAALVVRAAAALADRRHALTGRGLAKALGCSRDSARRALAALAALEVLVTRTPLRLPPAPPPAAVLARARAWLDSHPGAPAGDLRAALRVSGSVWAAVREALGAPAGHGPRVTDARRARVLGAVRRELAARGPRGLATRRLRALAGLSGADWAFARRELAGELIARRERGSVIWRLRVPE